MALENEEVCRFCLKALENTNFEIIENLKLGMLDVLLLKLNFTVSIAPLVCSRCVESLKKAFYFKTACLSVEQTINLFVSASRNLKVDLKEVYLAQKINGRRKVIREDQKVCRFCLRLFKNYVLNDIGNDVALTGVLQKYFPELDLSITKEILACANCLDGLRNNFDFIMHCLDTENHIKKYCEIEGIPSNEQINLRHVSQFVAILRSIDPDSDDYYSDVAKNGTGENRLSGENTCLTEYRVLGLDNFGGHGSAPVLEQNHFLRSQTTEAKPVRKARSKGSPRTKHRVRKTNKPTSETPKRPRRCTPRVHQCPHCPFQTEFKSTLDKHLLQHKEDSEVTIYKCELCAFATKHKGSLKRHALAHSATRPEYECPKCAFKTTSKKSFSLHGNIHLQEYELCAPVYQCEECPQKSGTKKELQKHMKSHKLKKTYSCNLCEFKTEDQSVLKSHKLTHNKTADPEGFKCDVCPFVTKHKGNLKIHTLTHKSSSETIMYKCLQCEFETKHKVSLRTHMLKHRSDTEVKCHECEVCGFKTKHKGNLKLHMVVHKSPTETVMYKCDRCDFQTKHKMSLRTHKLKHKRKSEVVRYRCEVCEFETRIKGNLKKHEMIHKDASELTWYSCRLCGFETIHKGSFKTHATSFHPQLVECEPVVEEKRVMRLRKDRD